LVANACSTISLSDTDYKGSQNGNTNEKCLSMFTLQSQEDKMQRSAPVFEMQSNQSSPVLE
jgi:hypothetical protein